MQSEQGTASREREANLQALKWIGILGCAGCVLIAACGALLWSLGPLIDALIGSQAAGVAPATGPVLYVSADGRGRACSSWENPCALQTALAGAQAGDEIWVKAGVYRPATDPRDPRATFWLKDGVALYGGFGGTETRRDQRDWKTHITVLSGDLAGDDRTDAHGVVTDPTKIVGVNAYHVVTGSGVSSAAILDGFTITAGYANLAPPSNEGFGGGMFNWRGSPTLNNLTFSGNTAGKGAAYYGGGGMFNISFSRPILNHVAFVANTAGSGGGMYNHNSNPVLNDVTFTGNEGLDAACMNNYMGSSPVLNGVVFDSNTSSNKGCMVNNAGSVPSLTHVTFSRNTSRYGSGMYNVQSAPILRDVVFTDNVSGHVGGAMENEDRSNPTLVNVLFSGNSAYHEGGAMFIAAGSNPMLTNVVFIDNRVSGDGGGGAIKTYNSSPILTNVTFSGNHAVVGGAIDNWHSSMILTNATLRGNSADQYGAAIYNQESNPTITNTIIWANYPAESQLLDARGESIVTYSIIAGGRPGPGNQEADPQLGSLADNDGGLPAFPLPPGSPAIDGGSPSGCPATDQLGLPRPVDGDGNGVVACDIGAVEYQGPK